MAVGDPADCRAPRGRLSPARLLRDNGLTLALLAIFLLTAGGMALAGWQAHNAVPAEHGAPPGTLAAFLRSGTFLSPLVENWESEFLQMAFYVLLTVGLFQLGSSESKRPGVLELVDLDPRESPGKDKAPWPVRRGGFILTLYENSLSIAFAILFALSFGLHAVTGVHQFNEERLSHGEPPASTRDYVVSSQFWFESFQNWQSEFLSLAAMVTFTIVLRQRGSPESKPVDAPIWETAD